VTRVLLADHREEVLQALASFIGEQCGLVVEGRARDAASLIDLAAHAPAEAILVEFGLPGREPAELFADLRRLTPRPRVIALGVRPEDGRAALRAGADAFVGKNEGGESTFDSLRQVLANPEEGDARTQAHQNPAGEPVRPSSEGG
jgi:DNA-binding NarL/FixJ family response regulator